MVQGLGFRVSGFSFVMSSRICSLERLLFVGLFRGSEDLADLESKSAKSSDPLNNPTNKT